jgi:very-short-patch-repair endonuclease
VAVAGGLLTPRQLRHRTWRRLFPDVYVHGDVPVTHALRARAAVVLRPDAVVTGASAAVLWDVELAGPDDDVEITLPSGSHPVRVSGLRVRREHLPDDWLCRRTGVRTTTPVATTVSVARHLPLDDAVVVIDQMVASGKVDLEPVRAAACRLTGRGCRRLRKASALADGLAESPQETRLRLLIVRSSLPVPVAQFRIRTGRVFVAKVDFGWPDRRLAVEYDGLWHAEPGQFGKDRTRLNQIHAAGWRVFFVTAADLHRPADLLARLAAALDR